MFDLLLRQKCAQRAQTGWLGYICGLNSFVSGYFDELFELISWETYGSTHTHTTTKYAVSLSSDGMIWRKFIHVLWLI